MSDKYTLNGKTGVWRTIGGRRVFIADGQSLSEAMRESGKFPSAKKKDVDAGMPKIPNAQSNLKDWPKVDPSQAKEFEKLDKEFVLDGKRHIVDGHHVKCIPDENELKVAEMLAQKYGCEVKIVPKIHIPSHIQTPDYYVNGVKYDLKTPDKYKGVFRRIEKSEGQAARFIIYTKHLPEINMVLKEVRHVFSNNTTSWVEEVLITDGLSINYAYKRQ